MSPNDPNDPNAPQATCTWTGPNPMPLPVEPLPMPVAGDTQPDHRSGSSPADTVSQVTPPAAAVAEPGTLVAPDGPPNSDGTLPQSPDEAEKAARMSQNVAVRPLPAIPGYQLLGELGRGGMGVVYRAWQVRLNRPTALKMLLGGQFSDTVAQVRFLVEAEVVAQVQHPNVVQVFEFGQADGQPFFALEFIDGGTLGGKLQAAGRFTAKDAAEMVAKLADGIAAAHAKGIVHRDLKPANVLIDQHGEPKITDFGLAKVGNSEMTASGAIMGTPSYMSPEQAAGKTKDIGTTTDIFALGVILYELLAGKVPFKGDSVMETIQQVLTREPAALRSVVPGLPRDLETICLKCLEKDTKKRYGTASELAADLRAYLDGRPIAARPVSSLERVWKWTKRNPGRAAAAVVTILVLVGAGIAANEVQKQRLAVEKQRAADLRATRADSLVRALSTANTPEVPRVIEELTEVQELARPKLVELAGQPINTKPGLHGLLALLADGPERVAELAAYLPVCQPDELMTIRQLLKPHAASVAPAMWATLYDEQAAAGKRVRAACALAGWSAEDERWPKVAPRLSEAVVRATPAEFVVWAEALEPVRAVVRPELASRYPVARDRIRSGKLLEADLGPEAAAFELTANLLARYTLESPELAEAAMTVEGRHYTQFAETINGKSRGAVIPLLKAELAKSALPAWAGTGEIGWAVAAVAGSAPVANVLNSDAALDKLAKRQGNAAAVLLTLGEANSAWPLFAFPKNGDASVRSYLLERLAAIGADPNVLVRRFYIETDVSAKRALLIALGDFPQELVPRAEREPLESRLLVLYRNDPDPGLHAAIDWLLRHKWGKAKDLAMIDTELAAEARSRVAAAAVAGSTPILGATGKGWFVSGEGHTFALVRGPVEFTLGSPPTEPSRHIPSEAAHRKRIGRTFAIGTKEVTVEQFLRFKPDHFWTKRYSPDPNCPVISVTWYDCAEYCNWLSAREGLPRDEWCYEPNQDGKYAEGMTMKVGHLSLAGYRLPTEAEWELGNAMEWCENPYFAYTTTQTDDIESAKYLTIGEQRDRVLRGSSFNYDATVLRSAVRSANGPGIRLYTSGFRPVRTLLN
ncbi:MAG: protein kinase [Planctomycetes bacterium]|nr:protein kinase [Planctomycetota bacterium]